MNNKKQADLVTKQEETVSRFSRRRFLHSSAIASPLLLSIKSPAAWGIEMDESRGSLANLMQSLDASNVNKKLTPRAPSYWASNYSENNKVVNDALATQGYLPDKTFFEYFEFVFPSEYTNWDENSNIQYRIQTVVTPTMLNALQGMQAMPSMIIIESVFEGKTFMVNIVENAPSFFMNATCSLLNSVFETSHIEYIAQSQAKSDIAAAINNSINNVLGDISNDLYMEMNDYSASLESFGQTLEAAWN